jgi:hypothetical protein
MIGTTLGLVLAALMRRTNLGENVMLKLLNAIVIATLLAIGGPAIAADKQASLAPMP